MAKKNVFEARLDRAIGRMTNYRESRAKRTVSFEVAGLNALEVRAIRRFLGGADVAIRALETGTLVVYATEVVFP